ncbi:hypothetical protein EPUL_003996 [Erysiphe pulchra]|uniref:Chitin-binding type-1 domain-containing protein n=1 Tax=Erysiphe pulchra TaxID=225359 RepID=A0A2S4PVW6_9PEZI|nr:hypothetical protein EPUL_003996 [Erysiphe pulchra]
MYISTLSSFAATALVFVVAQGHMEMSYPAPFRSRYNPHIQAGTADFSMTSPLKSDGSDFPCKGYHKDMKDSTGAGAPVVTWNSGSTYNYTIIGGAPHNGGSCQAALSYDNGVSFKVIHSYIGDCPIMNTGNFDFTVPVDAKSGNAIFAWTWQNQVGNREYYMNCASVQIDGSQASSGSPKVSFSSRPDLFVANIGNGCTTVEGKDTVYPEPGPDVSIKSGESNSASTITGKCKGLKTREVLSLKSSPNSALVPRFSNSTSNSSIASPVRIMLSTTMMPTAASGSCSPNTAMKASKNGECGGFQTCSDSVYGGCCSQYGYCGDSAAHCGDGCMEEFGICGMNVTVLKLRMRRPHFQFA